MSRAFASMDNSQVAAALGVLFDRGEVERIGEGFMPEADLLFCRWRGQRVNVKFDLIYGPDLYLPEPGAAPPLAEFEALIASIDPP